MNYNDNGNIKQITVKSGDTLPVGTIVEFDGTTIPAGYEQVEEEKDIYSLEEVKTNKVWIDGKPLYRKMVDTGIMPSNSGKYFEHGISNVEHIHINLGETMWIGNNESFTGKTTVFSPIFSDDSGVYIRQLAANSSSIQIGTSNVNANYFKLLVCVEYTKTTD